jgi:hypothetical protein
MSSAFAAQSSKIQSESAIKVMRDQMQSEIQQHDDELLEEINEAKKANESQA